jgi:peroxiredoxin
VALPQHRHRGDRSAHRRRAVISSIAVSTFLMLASRSAATHGEEPLPAGHSYHGEAFNEGPRQAAYLMPGMAPIQFPTSTSEPRAQALFNQGIAQLHGFWYLEAERSFRGALALDENFAMAYWGMAMANRNTLERARKFIDQADQRKDSVTTREKHYIESLTHFLQAEEDATKREQEEQSCEGKASEGKASEDKASEDKASEDKACEERAKQQSELRESQRRESARQRRLKLIEEMERVLDESPEDIECKALLVAEHWFAKDAGLEISSRYAINALLGEIFEASPQHPAHHYRIHLWDYVRGENALASAAACGSAAPGIAHMWHMPGHTYTGLKRYADAAWQQEASARVDHAYMIRDRVMPDQIHNYAHNNEWLIRNLLLVGRGRDACELAINMISLPRHPQYNTNRKNGSFRYGRQRLMQALVDQEDWEGILRETTSGWLRPVDDEGDTLMRLQWQAIASYLTDQESRGDELTQQLRGLQIRWKESLQSYDESKKGCGLDGKGEAKKNAARSEADRKAAECREQQMDQLRGLVQGRLTESIGLCEATASAVAGRAKAAQRVLRRCGEVRRPFASRLLERAGDLPMALQAADEGVDAGAGEVLPLAQRTWLRWQGGDAAGAAADFESLRSLAARADLDHPLLARLDAYAQSMNMPTDWRLASAAKEDFGPRPDLQQLGPFRWHPYEAPSWTVADTKGQPLSLESFRGRPVVVVFYLGFGCLHCVEQLKALEPEASSLRAQGIEVVAISSEDLEQLNKGVAAYNESLSIPLLADPELRAFSAYRCFDDFERKPLHGTFLIDEQGKVRWQDIGHQPFMDIAFLKDEAQRLLAP